MRSDEDEIDVNSDVNRRRGMVFIRRSGKEISGRFFASREDLVEV